MYAFLTSFGMHSICMWIFGHDLLQAWRIAWIDSELPSLAISLIAMEIMGLFHYFVLVGSHVSLSWVELLVLGSLGWTNALESRQQLWVELLVLATLVGKKRSRSPGRLV